MKHLNTYKNESFNMKPMATYITEYIIKKKLDTPIDSEDHQEYCPTSKGALKDITRKLMKQGIYDFNCIDTSKITDMSSLFDYNLDYIDKNFDVSDWDVSNVTDMKHMFVNCENFNCDLSNWDVSKVTNMKYMFANCPKFTGKGLENWNIRNVTRMNDIFEKCTSLKNKPSWYKE